MPLSLEKCMDTFTAQEDIKDGYCSQCKELRDASMKMDIWRLPPILVIHLKRFQYTTYSRRKLRNLVKVTLHPYMKGEEALSSYMCVFCVWHVCLLYLVCVHCSRALCYTFQGGFPCLAVVPPPFRGRLLYDVSSRTRWWQLTLNRGVGMLFCVYEEYIWARSAGVPHFHVCEQPHEGMLHCCPCPPGWQDKSCHPSEES
ncbi:unnamed protein product [Discosporangium mesarthrocarpum]